MGRPTIGSCSRVPAGHWTPSREDSSPADGYFDKTQWAKYVCPSSVNGGLWCSSPQGRGTMTGPAYQNVDFNVIKRFRITESSSVSLQASLLQPVQSPEFRPPDFQPELGFVRKVHERLRCQGYPARSAHRFLNSRQRRCEKAGPGPASFCASMSRGSLRMCKEIAASEPACKLPAPRLRRSRPLSLLIPAYGRA